MDSSWFGKSFTGKSFFIGESLNFIDIGKPSWAKFPDWLIQLMEAILVKIFSKVLQPDIQKSFTLEVKLNTVGSLFDDSNSHFFFHDWFLLVNFEFLFEEDLEFEIKL